MEMRQKMLLLLTVRNFIMRGVLFFLLLLVAQEIRNRKARKTRFMLRARRYSIIARMPEQSSRLFRLFEENDVNCQDILQMDRNCFLRLCSLLQTKAGLLDGQYVSLKEQVAMFLSILAHHVKNRKVRFDFYRSGEIVSKYFHIVLCGVLKLHRLFLVTPTTPNPEFDDDRWLPFQDCLGELDGTHIDVRVLNIDKPRYRSRKGNVSINVLAACDRNVNFIYVLTGWEGSAADSLVLKDVIYHPNSFKVPRGKYYICDNGYTHGEGFLTPYRAIRYHLKEWCFGRELPQNYKEYFNMKHCKAMNVIERAFGILKERWAILRSEHFYPIKYQNKVILACALLHNFIRLNMHMNPLEDWVMPDPNEGMATDDRPPDYIDVVEPSPEWNNFRDELAQNHVQHMARGELKFRT